MVRFGSELFWIKIVRLTFIRYPVEQGSKGPLQPLLYEYSTNFVNSNYKEDYKQIKPLVFL